ncbi:hypothetical protein JOF55_004558 [Haloactinomyces albus]|uniref:Zinc-finger n=1 Tax=Haloactinomyces albus TaxID=1352928 RepID=A0AAE4CQS0_9ACTN|nr:hypothetical protein [Haloactinomyces albus]
MDYVFKTSEESHFWMPIPSSEQKRHAFRGARRWDGRRSGETVCGVRVPMAQPSEMDWIMIPTCPHCWSALVAEHDGERTSGSAS